MNNFNDRVYLLLTLTGADFRNYYLQTISILIVLSCYNLISVFAGTPRLISYTSLAVAFILISILFIYLKLSALPIDWKLLEAVEEELQNIPEKPKEKAENMQPVVMEEPAELEEPSNEEVQMIEDELDEFDFADNLADLYKTGTPQQMSEVAVKGIEQKVRRMNIR